MPKIQVERHQYDLDHNLKQYAGHPLQRFAVLESDSEGKVELLHVGYIVSAVDGDSY